MKRLGTFAMAGVLLAAMAGPTLAAPPHFRSFDFDFFDKLYERECVQLSDKRIRERVADLGYTDIYLNQWIRDRIQVRAVKDGWYWLLRVSKCGEVLNTRQWRRV